MATVRIGEASLTYASNAEPDTATVRVGEAAFVYATNAGNNPPSVIVGEAIMRFEQAGVTPNPATVRVGETIMRFGAPPIATTGYWVYRGGVLCPVRVYAYDSQGVLS